MKDPAMPTAPRLPGPPFTPTAFKDPTTTRGSWQAILLPTRGPLVAFPGGETSNSIQTALIATLNRQPPDLSNDCSYRSSAPKALRAQSSYAQFFHFRYPFR